MEHHQVQTERLVIVIEIRGRVASGKTQAAASIIQAIEGLTQHAVRINSEDPQLKRQMMREPDFNRNDIALTMEAFHRGA